MRTSDAVHPTAQPPVAPAVPVITVVRGRPSPDELAAIVAVLAAQAATAAAGQPGDPVPVSCWADRSRAMPAASVMSFLPRPSSHAWRASSWPR